MNALLDEMATEISERASELGVTEWADEVKDWSGSVLGGAHVLSPAAWYLTDMRHEANLASPRMQGLVDDETPMEREDALNELGDMISDFIEAHHEDEGSA